MKVLHLVHTPQRRGAEIFASQLAAEQRRQGWPVRTVYLYPYRGTGALELAPGDVCLDGSEHHPSERLLGFHPGLLSRVVRSIRDFEPDIVQTNGARTMKYGALARRLSGGPWSLVYRNIAEPDRWMAGRLRRIFYRALVMPGVDGVVGVSDATVAVLAGMYKLGMPTTSIPRGVDPAALVPTRTRAAVRAAIGTPEGVPVVIFIGSLTAEKRPDRLLRVFGQVRRAVPEARLWVIGDGPLRPAAAAQVAAAGLEGAVALLGIQDRVADFLGAADLLLLTSDTEGTPGTVLEAGMAGLPVVATRVGGVATCVVEGETALLADPDDDRALANAVIALLGDELRRAQLGAAGRDWVTQRFSIGAIAARFHDFYVQASTSGR